MNCNVSNFVLAIGMTMAKQTIFADEKRHDEYFHMLIRLFETPHIDNMKILKALLYSKDDMLPLVDGTTKTRV